MRLGVLITEKNIQISLNHQTGPFVQARKASYQKRIDANTRRASNKYSTVVLVLENTMYPRKPVIMVKNTA